MNTLVRRTAVVIGVALATLCVWPAIAYARLVADWEMTDVGTPPPTMTDASGNGNNGNPSGGVVGDGSSFSFDGTGIVVVPDTGTLEPGSADIKIVAAISFTQLPNGDYDIVRKKPAGIRGTQYRVEVTKFGRARCFFTGDTGGATITATPILDDGQFHTVVCKKTASRIGVRVDAGKLKSKSVTIGSISNGYAISVGAKADCSAPCNADAFVGSIDRVVIRYRRSGTTASGVS